MNSFIRVRSPKFAVLPGEDEELINEGTYGKALAEYLADELRHRGYDVPFVCCEDWGWWIELKGFSFSFGVCVYGSEIGSGQLDLYVTDGAVGERAWSWKKFWFVDTRDAASKLRQDLIAIFESDPEVDVLGTDLDAPFVD